MSVVIVLILASLVIGLIFIGAFVWAVRAGQYDDTMTPALRVLTDDVVRKKFEQAGSSSAPHPVADQNNPGR